MADLVSVTDDAGVRLLTLERPDKKNAFNVELADAVWRELEAASAEPDVRVVAMTGAGSMFTAGADVTLFAEAASNPAGAARVARVYEPLRACAKPTIAIVNGPAVGMGVTILPHFDLVYAASTATFTTPFVRLGLVLEYGSAFTLHRMIGRQRAREMILRGAPIDAATALDWGFVTRVFPPAELRASAMAIAKEIAAHPATAVRECKRLLDLGEAAAIEDVFDAEHSALAGRYGSEETMQAVMAFLASRTQRKVE